MGARGGGDSLPSQAVGCAQLCRLAVGGYLVLRRDFLVATVLVRPEWRRIGVATALLDELLNRLPCGPGNDAGRAWAVISEADAEAVVFLQAAGGTPRGSLAKLVQAEPLIATALLLSGGALPLL